MQKIRKINCILRPINDLCNISCTYCNTKDRYSKDSYKNNKINMDIIKALCHKFSLYGFEEVTFSWHGGEPLLLGNDFYNDVLKVQKQYLSSNTVINNVIQTNGTLLNVERIKFLKENNFYVGISIDGFNYDQNSKRFENEDVFKNLLDNIKRCKDYGLDYSFTMVINEKNIHYVNELYDFFVDQEPNNGFITNPLFLHKNEQQVTGDTVTPENLTIFLSQMYDKWKVNKELKNNYISSVNMGLDKILPKSCFLSGRCRNYMNINGNGDIYSTCHENKDYYVGNILENDIHFLIKKQLQNNQRILESFDNSTLYEELGEVKDFIAFQGKGCPKRMINGKDFYFESYKNIIRDIRGKCVEE